MACAVFFRAVNVGGHRTFRPAILAADLAALDVASLGAAGTFVVGADVEEARLREQIQARVPFSADLVVCPARDVLDLVASAPFAGGVAEGVRPYVTILAADPARAIELPLERPAGDDWQVRVLAVRGRFVTSLHRRTGARLIYPNEVVEKALGVAATTRNWDTMQAVAGRLGGDGHPAVPVARGRSGR